MREKAVKWINWIRLQELEVLNNTLAPLAESSVKLLEIGGGNGFLAKHLADMGFDVVSIDIEPREPRYFNVQCGYCTKLEFDDDCFDIIFSSNVLEHVVDLSNGLVEMKRVLKPGGIMIHTMPTPVSTFLTMCLQPVGYFLGIGFVINQALKFAASQFKVLGARQVKKETPDSFEEPKEAKPLNRQNLVATLKMINPLRLMITPPHGTCPLTFTELFQWRTDIWCKKFRDNGLSVMKVVKLPLTYSRHLVLPFCFIGLRRLLAKKGLVSCAGYILTVEDGELRGASDQIAL